MKFGPQDIPALLDTVRRLQRSAASGHVDTPLRGKNVALLSERTCAATERVRAAALRLGAQVTQLRPSESRLAEGQLRTTAQLLGRLYDAIDCESVAPALVEQLRRDAGVPVFEGLGDDRHAGHAAVDIGLHDDGVASRAELRDLVVQAMLINTIN